MRAQPRWRCSALTPGLSGWAKCAASAIRSHWRRLSRHPNLRQRTGRDRAGVVEWRPVLTDSWQIAEHLDRQYGGGALLTSVRKTQLIRLSHHWCRHRLLAPLTRICVLDILKRLQPADRAYCRQSREDRLGTPLEQTVAGCPERLQTSGSCTTALGDEDVDAATRRNSFLLTSAARSFTSQPNLKSAAGLIGTTASHLPLP